MAAKHGFNLKLEQYLLGELPAAEKAKIDAELKTNADLRRELERLKGDTGAYFAKYPRLAKKAKNSWWSLPVSRTLAGGLAFATAVVSVVLLLPQQQQMVTGTVTNNGNYTGETQGSENGVRTKGLKPALFLTVVREGKAESLADGSRVRGGDEIQIGYRASGHGYGAIFSVDAEKSVTLHFPESTAGSQKLGSGAMSLKQAFKLDEKPGFEKFYFIASDRELPLKKMQQELAKTGKLASVSEKEVQVISILLKKE
jgi:hypothetical protein